MAKKPTFHVVSDPAALGTEPPRPLGQAGRSLWTRVQTEYAIGDCAGVEYLAQACEGLDLIEELAEQIRRDGAIVRVRGVPKAHPAMRDLLQAKAFVVRTLARLNLDMEAVKPMGRPAGVAGWDGFR
jgi:hypothetical protein